MNIRTQMWIHPIAGPQVSRHGVCAPLIAPPPGQTSTPICPSDLTIIERHRQRIIDIAQNEVQWIQIEGFVPPSGLLTDFDIVLLAVVDTWLRHASPGNDTWIGVNDTLATALTTHPSRQFLCNRFGKAAVVGDQWPNYSWGHSMLLDRVRKWHAAGYLELASNYTTTPVSHAVAPRQRGVIRAVWLAQRLGLPLPPLIPVTADDLVSATAGMHSTGPAPPR